MPDISMCAHATCPLRQSCYRHAESGTVPSSPHQWYGEFEPRMMVRMRKPNEWHCDGYEPKRKQP